MHHHGLAFCSQPLEPVAALDDLDAQTFLQLANAHGKRRLGKAAVARGAREMAVPSQRQQAFKVSEVKHVQLPADS